MRRKKSSRAKTPIGVSKAQLNAPGRYTPPKAKSRHKSPPWVSASMFTCLLVGVAVILGNYLSLLPGGPAQNSDLFLGLGLIIVGFGLSTRLR